LHGRLEGVRLVDGRLQITPVRTDPDAEAKALGNRIDGMMLRIRITELLHNVASETTFSPDSLTCERAGRATTKMRCSPPSSPTAPISCSSG
jgi:hypothetical protein